MAGNDFRINAATRAVIARHWLETEALSLSAINGVLYVRGIVRFRSARAKQLGEVTPSFLSRLEKELRAIREVRAVRFQLDNWARDDTGWYRTEGRRKQRQPSGPARRPER